MDINKKKVIGDTIGWAFVEWAEKNCKISEVYDNYEFKQDKTGWNDYKGVFINKVNNLFADPAYRHLSQPSQEAKPSPVLRWVRAVEEDLPPHGLQTPIKIILPDGHLSYDHGDRWRVKYFMSLHKKVYWLNQAAELPSESPTGDAVEADKDSILHELADFIIHQVYPEFAPDKVEMISEDYVDRFLKSPPSAPLQKEAVEANQPADRKLLKTVANFAFNKGVDFASDPYYLDKKDEDFFNDWFEDRYPPVPDKPVEGLKEEGEIPEEVAQWIVHRSFSSFSHGQPFNQCVGALKDLYHKISAALAAEKEANAKLRESYRLSSEEHKRAYSSLWGDWEDMARLAESFLIALKEIASGKALPQSIAEQAINKFTNKDKDNEKGDQAGNI